jgi:threonine aldolase
MGWTVDKTLLRHQFASDNYSGICPEVLSAIEGANVGHTRSYGADPFTERAVQMVRDWFETDCAVFFVFNGTSANALGLASMCDSYHTVITYAASHLESDECGAPGFFAHGVTLTTLAVADGKLTPALVERAATARTDIHHNKAGALNISQATELGTIYTPDEIAALAAVCRKRGLHFHMDGARFANAVVALGAKPRQITWEAGVDVLSLGGTKNGALAAEAVIFFNRKLAEDFEYRRKQAGQLASKMRFLAAQWIGLLQDDVWRRNATNANRMAARLEQGLKTVPSLTILYPRQANAVFVAMPQNVFGGLHKRGWFFYNDVGPDGGARLMCSWNTTEQDVDGLLNDIKELAKGD